MKISARNQIKGKIVAIDHGVTTSHVKIDIGGGSVITSAITKTSVEELKLDVGKQVVAIVKASDVMVGVE
ncbi:MAG: TOBE domain-containing protein [Pseudomonadota bacterium]